MKTTLKSFLPMWSLFAGLLALLLSSSAPAADGTPLWTNRFNGAGNSYDYAQSIAVGSSGNVYVTGRSAGIGDVSDYATIKYSSAGIGLWTNLFNGAATNNFNSDNAFFLALDNSGNVIVTGCSYGNESGFDYATIKYSSGGTPLWTNLFNGVAGSHDIAVSLVADGAGNAFVTGYSIGSGGYSDYATIKYSSGGVPIWTNLFNGAANHHAEATAIGLDTNGNVFVTGASGIGGGSDYATIKYSGDGVALWTNQFNGIANGDDKAVSLAVDNSGAVCVTGYSVGSGGNSATIKYSNTGVSLWTNLFSGTANALTVDGSGNVYVAGGSMMASSSGDYTTIKYSSLGIPQWTNFFNSPENYYDVANRIALDGSGNVYVTGNSRTWNNSSFYDNYVTIKYSNTGMPLWTNLFDRVGYTESSAISLAVDGGGNVYLAGDMADSGGYSDYVTIKYSKPESLTPIPLEIKLEVNQVVLSWTNTNFNLQSATYASGVYTNIPNANSPYTNLVTDTQRFFRLISN